MLAYILRRIMIMIPTLLGVTIIVFLMLHATPGDPAELLLGERATIESLEQMREHLGLNEPLHVQYGLFLSRLLKGDLGETIWTRQKVWIEIKHRFPATIELSLVALCISCFAGMLLGIISATKQYSIFDYVSMIGALAGVGLRRLGTDGRFIWLEGVRELSGELGAARLLQETGIDSIEDRQGHPVRSHFEKSVRCRFLKFWD